MRSVPILLPSQGPRDWQRLLAQPALHWKAGRSASAMAHAWEQSGGWPPAMANLFRAAFGECQPLVVVPEWQTPLPGGETSSQSDAFLLLGHAGGTVAVTVEGKVNESFGPTVADKRRGATPGVAERLTWLCGRLGLEDCSGDVHYQLLHRTAAALVEAERFHAADAAMIVHSFAPDRRWYDAFSRFVTLLGGEAVAGQPIRLAVPGPIRLTLGWISAPLPVCRCDPQCHEPNGITAA